MFYSKSNKNDLRYLIVCCPCMRTCAAYIILLFTIAQNSERTFLLGFL